MNKETLALHELDCDKCCGSGKVYGKDICELIQRWRSQLGITRKLLAVLAKIPYESYCKFEKGSVAFGEARIRNIIQILKIRQHEADNEGLGVGEPSTCPECDSGSKCDCQTYEMEIAAIGVVK